MDISSLRMSGALAALLGAAIVGGSGSAYSSTTVDAEAVASVPRGSIVVDVEALGLRSAPAGSGLHVAYGGKDQRGCSSLVVWRGSHRVKVIESHEGRAHAPRRR